MFKHLLVPLDGSRLSESALPAAAQIAARMGADLTLVHIVEKHAPAEVHSDRHLVSAEEASLVPGRGCAPPHSCRPARADARAHGGGE